MLVRNATLPDGRTRDVRVDGESIAAVGSGLDLDGDERLLDADGATLLPGAIDVHVHFREPGGSHKETWLTGSKSAAAGGVTTVVDQPNTDPPTVDGDAVDEKARLASDSLVDYGINGGVTPSWDPETLFDRPIFALGEVFLADSTGDMGIDEERFRDALERAREADVVVTVHAEDATRFDESARERDDADAWSAYRSADAEIAAVERACDLADDAGAQLHVAHTSTPEAVDIVADAGEAVTCEVTPHHCFLSREDLPELGTFGRMNPPLRSEDRRAALFERIADGRVDVVATDHAPHTRQEKDASIWAAPSGVPGVETMQPLLLHAVREADLTTERVVELTARNPAEIFDLPEKGAIEEGADADLALFDLDSARQIRGDDMHTRCEWTPFEGWPGVFPSTTTRRGTVVYERKESDVERFAAGGGRNVRS
jgi:dihydroorotase